MVVEPDPYMTLGVDPAASTDRISAAFRRLARLYHPDGRAQNPRRMIEINRAYDLIKTPERRRRYDEGRRLAAVGPGWEPADGGQPFDSRPQWVRRAMAGNMRGKVTAP
jgi:curved DNA-binding protein CbpA